jgi:hypothetical protein
VRRPLFFFDGEDLVVAAENDFWSYIEEFDIGEYDPIFDIDGAMFEFVRDGHTWLLRPTGAKDLPDLTRRAEKFAAAANLAIGDDDYLVALADWEEEWRRAHRRPKRPRWLANRMQREVPPPYARG